MALNNIFDKISEDNERSKKNISKLMEKIDFESLTPEKNREKTLMIKVDADVWALFGAIAKRKGHTIKAMGNYLILDFLKKYNEEI